MDITDDYNTLKYSGNNIIHLAQKKNKKREQKNDSIESESKVQWCVDRYIDRDRQYKTDSDR